MKFIEANLYAFLGSIFEALEEKGNNIRFINIDSIMLENVAEEDKNLFRIVTQRAKEYFTDKSGFENSVNTSFLNIMPNIIIPFKDYKFKSNKTYFLDNNIWISLFAPIINTNKEQQKKASSFFFKNITSYNPQIVINSLILSEFTNRFLRFDFDAWKRINQNPTANYKKEYKQSQKFKETLIEIKDIIRTITNIEFVEKYPDNFNSINIENIINNFEIDFNDAYYLELCSKNNWILVTSDNDFDNIDKEITIIKI